MADYVELDGVQTWYDERGAGDPVVLLHGGLSDTRVFEGNLTALADRFRVFLPERRGHGHTADVDGPITLDLIQDTIAFLERVVGGAARLVGYSAGGTVALFVALRRPDLVERLVLVSGTFHWDGWILRPAVGAVPPPIAQAYGEVSPDGAEHLPAVVAKVAESMAVEPTLTPADLGGVGCRTLVLAADDDLVALDHTVALYRGLPTAELAVIPAASHGLLMEHPELCTGLIGDFLSTGPAPTIMPIDRAGK